MKSSRPAVDTGIADRNVVLATFDASAAGYSRTSGVLFYECQNTRRTTEADDLSPVPAAVPGVLTVVARANRDAGGCIMAIRDAARSLDPALAPYNLRMLPRQVPPARHRSITILQ